MDKEEAGEKKNISVRVASKEVKKASHRSDAPDVQACQVMSLIFCFRLVLTVALMILDDIELLIYPILYLVFFGDKFTAKTISIFSGINSKNIVESQPISIGENQVDTFIKNLATKG